MLSLLNQLKDRGILTASNFTMLERFANRWNLTSFDAILETNILSESKLADFVAEIGGYTRIQALPFESLPEKIFQGIDYKTARALEVLPLGDLLGHDDFLVLMVNPTDMNKVGMVQNLLGTKVTLGVGERNFVRKMIDKFYPLSMQLPHILGGVS